MKIIMGMLVRIQILKKEKVHVLGTPDELEMFLEYEERAEIVRSCRYVDEVAEIPLDFGGTRDAWKLHHFDCQFSGSDYVDNVDWLAEKEFLEKHGAEMEFFPYTQSTSSSKIKKLIDKKLL